MRRVLAIELVALGMTLGPVHAALGDDSKRATPPTAPPSSAAAPLVWDDLPGPQLEVVQHPSGSGTPTIPPFTLPATEPGFRSPRELRVRGRPLLGVEVKVRGFVTWAYNCPEALAIANPRATRAQIETAIHDNPALCERPMFSLGDAPDTSRDASITAVSPDPPVRGAPAFAAGDYVVVTGRWSVPAAPNGASREGVLVWSTVERAGPNAMTVAEPVAALQEMEMDLDGPPVLPVRKAVDDQTINTSIEHMNACNQAIVARRYDTAVSECQVATDIWDGNHLAWYARAGAHLARREWRQAKAAAERAVTLRPDQAMYQLYHGVALYHAELERVRGEQALKAGKKPEDIEVEPGLLQLDAARDALRRAVKLDPRLWRAHLYLGRVYRDLDDSRRAARQFTETITSYPSYPFGYLALIELYRRWSYNDQAAAVAQQGTLHVAPAESGELWFELGMACDARREDDKAIDAFTRALAVKPGDLVSKFHRGQAYYRKNDYANAKRDLEEVARSSDPAVATTKPLAMQMLDQIAHKH